VPDWTPLPAVELDRLLALTRELAAAAASKREHEPGDWHPPEPDSTQMQSAACARCGAMLYVGWTQPGDRRRVLVEFGGAAVFLRCTGERARPS
jgi:hypothetical protein